MSAQTVEIPLYYSTLKPIAFAFDETSLAFAVAHSSSIALCSFRNRNLVFEIALEWRAGEVVEETCVTDHFLRSAREDLLHGVALSPPRADDKGCHTLVCAWTKSGSVFLLREPRSLLSTSLEIVKNLSHHLKKAATGHEMCTFYFAPAKLRLNPRQARGGENGRMGRNSAEGLWVALNQDSAEDALKALWNEWRESLNSFDPRDVQRLLRAVVIEWFCTQREKITPYPPRKPLSNGDGYLVFSKVKQIYLEYIQLFRDLEYDFDLYEQEARRDVRKVLSGGRFLSPALLSPLTEGVFDSLRNDALRKQEEDWGKIKNVMDRWQQTRSNAVRRQFSRISHAVELHRLFYGEVAPAFFQRRKEIASERGEELRVYPKGKHLEIEDADLLQILCEAFALEFAFPIEKVGLSSQKVIDIARARIRIDMRSVEAMENVLKESEKVEEVQNMERTSSGPSGADPSTSKTRKRPHTSISHQALPNSAQKQHVESERTKAQHGAVTRNGGKANTTTSASNGPSATRFTREVSEDESDSDDENENENEEVEEEEESAAQTESDSDNEEDTISDTNDDVTPGAVKNKYIIPSAAAFGSHSIAIGTLGGVVAEFSLKEDEDFALCRRLKYSSPICALAFIRGRDETMLVGTYDGVLYFGNEIEFRELDPSPIHRIRVMCEQNLIFAYQDTVVYEIGFDGSVAAVHRESPQLPGIPQGTFPLVRERVRCAEIHVDCCPPRYRLRGFTTKIKIVGHVKEAMEFLKCALQGTARTSNVGNCYFPARILRHANADCAPLAERDAIEAALNALDRGEIGAIARAQAAFVVSLLAFESTRNADSSHHKDMVVLTASKLALVKLGRACKRTVVEKIVARILGRADDIVCVSSGKILCAADVARSTLLYCDLCHSVATRTACKTACSLCGTLMNRKV